MADVMPTDMPADMCPVSFGIKVTNDEGGHVHFNLFAGTTPDARGCCGSLTMRPEEFEEFVWRLDPEAIQPEAYEPLLRVHESARSVPDA